MCPSDDCPWWCEWAIGSKGGDTWESLGRIEGGLWEEEEREEDPENDDELALGGLPSLLWKVWSTGLREGIRLGKNTACRELWIFSGSLTDGLRGLPRMRTIDRLECSRGIGEETFDETDLFNFECWSGDCTRFGELEYCCWAFKVREFLLSLRSLTWFRRACCPSWWGWGEPINGDRDSPWGGERLEEIILEGVWISPLGIIGALSLSSVFTLRRGNLPFLRKEEAVAGGPLVPDGEETDAYSDLECPRRTWDGEPLEGPWDWWWCCCCCCCCCCCFWWCLIMLLWASFRTEEPCLRPGFDLELDWGCGVRSPRGVSSPPPLYCRAFWIAFRCRTFLLFDEEEAPDEEPRALSGSSS